MSEQDSQVEYQRACIDAARSIAMAPLDGDSTGGIDAETREAARVFLRSEFKRWTDEGSEPNEYDEDEAGPVNSDGQHEPA